MKTKQFFMLGIVAMMASCSSDNSVSETEERVPIQIFSSSSKIGTRASNVAANLQDAQFVAGSKMNIYLTKTGTSDKIGDNAYNEFTVGSAYSSTTSLQLNPPSGISLYYPSDGKGVDAYALYPSVFGSSSTKLDKTTTEFTVESNQSTADGYKKSDLMYAWKENTSRINNPIQLVFNHCMSKVVVELVSGSGVTDADLDNATITMKAVATATITQNTTSSPYTVSATAKSGVAASDIQFGIYDKTNKNAAIIVPQTISANTHIFDVKIGSGTYSCKTTGETKFEAGMVHKYTLTVSSAGVVVVSVRINNWNPGTNYDGAAEL